MNINETSNMHIIADLVDKLKVNYNPDLVVLFGSRAGLNFDEDSDIDLLIVKNTKKRPLWRRIEVRKVLATDKALDVVVYTPDEFTSLKKSRSTFIEEVLDKGIVLYERK